MTADKAIEAIREAAGGAEGPLRQALVTLPPSASSYRGLKAFRSRLDEVFELYDKAVAAAAKKPAGKKDDGGDKK